MSWDVYNITNSGLPNNAVYSIVIDDDDVKWIGTGGGGLVKFSEGEWTVFDPSNSDLPKDFIYSIVVDENNNKTISLWKGGLTLYNENGVKL